MGLKRKEKRAGIAVTVRKGLMQSVQSLPADALSGLSFFHSIRHQVFHGAGVQGFSFPQFCQGRFLGEGDYCHLVAISLIAIH
tara:strand:- start:268 stop:516 length:249 start_codon:yes stop_codon:yes gene_type:complete